MNMFDDYYKMPKALLLADGYVSPSSGKDVVLSSGDKVVYIVLYERNRWFHSEGKTHYDSQEDISIMCGMHPKTVGRIVRAFVKEGIVLAERNNKRNWIYKKVLTLQLYKGEEKEHITVPSKYFRSVRDNPSKQTLKVVGVNDVDNLPW